MPEGQPAGIDPPVAGPACRRRYLDRPIDFDLIERRFVLPPTIRLDREQDLICDDAYYSHVYGGDAQRRLREQYPPRDG